MCTVLQIVCFYDIKTFIHVLQIKPLQFIFHRSCQVFAIRQLYGSPDHFIWICQGQETKQSSDVVLGILPCSFCLMVDWQKHYVHPSNILKELLNRNLKYREYTGTISFLDPMTKG